MHGLSKLTELHPAGPIEVHPTEILRELFPDHRPWVGMVNAQIAGWEKYGPEIQPSEVEEELSHIENHIKAIRRGEIYDKNDGQVHASSIGLRAYKLHLSQCAGGT